MNQLHPAVQLQVVQTLFLVLAVPAMAWFSMVRGRDDRAARWWYAGLALQGIGVFAVALLVRVTAFTACLVSLSVLVCVTSIQMENAQRPFWPRWLMVLCVVWGALYAWIDWQGQWSRWGVPTFMGTLTVLYAYLLFMLVRTGYRLRSRGLLLVGLGVGLIGLVYANRGLTTLVQSRADPIFSYTLNANAVIVALSISAVLMAMGYAAFIQEKIHQRKLQESAERVRAEEQSRLAMEHAQAQKRIVAQRDELLMANARFSAMNTLTMFHSAIIHELSQPLQTLQSTLDKIDMRASRGDVGMRQDAGRAMQVLKQMTQSMSSLRELISSQGPRIEPIDLLPVIEEVSAIVETEANRRGILFDYKFDIGGKGLLLLADRVLLHRTILNLITNAFEAHEQAPADQKAVGAVSRMVRLVVGHRSVTGKEMVCVAVEDNGPGFEPGLLAQVGHQYATTKVGGVGLGLVLTRMVVESWGGVLRVGNRAGGGARVEMLLAQA